MAPLALACLDPDSFGDGLTTALFHHFRTFTITDFALIPDSTVFWDRHVLPLSNAIPAVRYATTALGVAHQAFLLRSLNPSNLQESQRLDFFTVQRYNQAIHQLLPHISSGKPIDIRIIITCCLLFYCLENIRGCSAESIQHLKAGSRLLVSLPPHYATETTRYRTNNDDAISEIATLFSRLGIEASLYSEDEVVPDLGSHRIPVPSFPEDKLQPFQDLHIARDFLWDIDVDLSTYNNKAFALAKEGGSRLPEDGISHLLDIAGGYGRVATVSRAPPTYGPSYESELRPIINRFRCWRKRFDRTVEEAEKRVMTKQERQEIMMLTLRQRVWETMLEEVPDGDPMLADSILDQAELLIQTFSSNHPIFTLESNIMSSTSFVCCYSDEVRHRRRALKILRSARIREGVWDSMELANLIEAGFPELKLGDTVSIVKGAVNVSFN
ncbi:hypothetical protein BKA67DRAFT_310092 [Truncatella angustata]|uniref:Uncharacterized protein n=1 Tax=Truncatella angustata TaxID=152316 RepID=A0A9P8ZXK3_9PEZI|nr:uncharacterized protein BKA67DRAFT_310092 [Truncatella angustata]KAH6653133.1 hypothetical protein BKA67DRAFT_310092 [Truncatella angustata]